jgi:hypothetical protein
MPCLDAKYRMDIFINSRRFDDPRCDLEASPSAALVSVGLASLQRAPRSRLCLPFGRENCCVVTDVMSPTDVMGWRYRTPQHSWLGPEIIELDEQTSRIDRRAGVGSVLLERVIAPLSWIVVYLHQRCSGD